MLKTAREKELERDLRHMSQAYDAVSQAYDSLVSVQRTKLLELSNLRQKMKRLELENAELIKKK